MNNHRKSTVKYSQVCLQKKNWRPIKKEKKIGNRGRKELNFPEETVSDRKE